MESTTPVTMTLYLNSHKPSCLAISRLLHVSVHCCLAIILLCGLSKKPIFVPVTSILIGTHRDCLFLASKTRYSILCLDVKSIFADLPLLMDRRTTKIV